MIEPDNIGLKESLIRKRYKASEILIREAIVLIE